MARLTKDLHTHINDTWLCQKPCAAAFSAAAWQKDTISSCFISEQTLPLSRVWLDRVNQPSADALQAAADEQLYNLSNPD